MNADTRKMERLLRKHFPDVSAAEVKGVCALQGSRTERLKTFRDLRWLYGRNVGRWYPASKKPTARHDGIPIGQWWVLMDNLRRRIRKEKSK